MGPLGYRTLKLTGGIKVHHINWELTNVTHFLTHSLVSKSVIREVRERKDLVYYSRFSLVKSTM